MASASVRWATESPCSDLVGHLRCPLHERMQETALSPCRASKSGVHGYFLCEGTLALPVLISVVSWHGQICKCT